MPNTYAVKDTQENLGKELMIHFYFTEQVPAWFKLFATFSFLWFFAVFAQARYGGLFEEVSMLPTSAKAVLVFYTLTPIALLSFVILKFYWWLAHFLVNFSLWGRGLKWARVMWFLVLIGGSFIYLDPFNIILKNIARFELIFVPGVGYLNPLKVLLWALALYFGFILCFYYLKQAFLVSVAKIREWWEYAVSLLIGMKITLIHLFRPNFTFYYPEQQREIPDYFRGRHILDFDENGEHLCISCKACERICPDRLILISFVKNPETKKLELTGFLLDNARCSFCGLCEDVCPTGAIRHTDEFAYSVEDRGELILDLLKEYRERSAPLREKRLRERQMFLQAKDTPVDATETSQASVKKQN